MGSYTFSLVCILHSIVATTSGVLMMFFYTNETGVKLMGSTPHDQLLIQISDSFSGLLLFALGFLLFMVAFIKDRYFQGFFARGCVFLHIATAVWRIYFGMKLQHLGGSWLRLVVGDTVLAMSWFFFLLYTWRDNKYD